MTGIPSPSQAEWYLGPIPIRAYAIAILAGIAVATWWADRRYRARGGPAEAVLDAVLWAVPFGIVGARAYHVFSSPDAYFGPDGDPLAALRIWDGGLGIWGAIPAGALGAWLSLRRHGLRLAPFADAIAPTILVAQGIGRLGNYFNSELFGSPTTLPWGLQISPEAMVRAGVDYPDGTLFHPTFLYEMLWNFAMAALLVLLARRFALGHGRVFWLYVLLYTLGRVWIELLRIDEAEMVLGLRLNVWTSILVMLGAAAAFVVIGLRSGGLPDPIWKPGREPRAAGSDAADDTTDPTSTTGAEEAGTVATTNDGVEEETPSSAPEADGTEPAPDTSNHDPR